MAKLLEEHARELISKLAYQLWEKRGRPFGSPEVGLVRRREGFGLLTINGASLVRHRTGGR